MKEDPFFHKAFKIVESSIKRALGAIRDFWLNNYVIVTALTLCGFVIISLYYSVNNCFAIQNNVISNDEQSTCLFENNNNEGLLKIVNVESKEKVLTSSSSANQPDNESDINITTFDYSFYNLDCNFDYNLDCNLDKINFNPIIYFKLNIEDDLYQRKIPIEYFILRLDLLNGFEREIELNEIELDETELNETELNETELDENNKYFELDEIFILDENKIGFQEEINLQNILVFEISESTEYDPWPGYEYYEKLQQETKKAEQLAAEEAKRKAQKNKTEKNSSQNNYSVKPESAYSGYSYPVAAYIWNYFRSLGYNEYVCAGIIGNIMAETGGQTMDIQYWLDGKGYFGMCQWYKKYYTGIPNANLKQQCDYLYSTIKSEINTFGFCYKSGFNYSSFLKITDEKQAALAFCVCYERPGPGSYKIRQKNATQVLKYFTGK